MSSSISKRYFRFHRATAHPLLSIFIPLLFLLTLDSFLQSLIPRLSAPMPLLALLLLSVGLEEALAGNIFFKERVSSFVRLRELILILLVMISILFAVYRIPLRPVNMLRPEFLYPLFLILLQWLLSLALHTRLRERELLWSAIAGKRGSRQIKALRDSSFQASYAIKGIKEVQGAIILFQVVIFVLVILTIALSKALSASSMVLVILHAFSGLLFIGVLNLFIEGQGHLGNGLIIPSRMEQKRLIYIAVVLGVCLAMVLLAARDASLLPLSWLLAFLSKLAQLFKYNPNHQVVERFRNMIPRSRQPLQFLLSAWGEARQPSLLLKLILELIKQLVRVIAFTALFFFLVAPLFSNYFLKWVRQLRPLALLWEKVRTSLLYLRRVSRRFVCWFKTLGTRRKLTAGEEKVLKMHPFVYSERSRRPGLRKKLQMGRVLKAFARLLKWGQRSGVPFFPANTPQEYTGRLAATVPDTEPSLGFIVQVFEEVMFSTHLVERDRITRYLRAVYDLCRQGVGRPPPVHST
ncbi:MAG TPA: DUF4129 domain-containing protein [Spirochaetales bacterium]|nr:DUF4129 domain-containing protein [Spirochaetales bacterium]